jgi:glycosyltransferase involved in cell wall biosynthesis
VRAVVVTGIWPPDVGGPAVHAPALAGFLTDRGHEVRVVTTAGRPPEARAYDVRWVARTVPAGLRHAAVASLVARCARGADVVYATSMIRRAAAGAAVARRPLVVKLVADEAYERARRAELFSGTLDEFQEFAGGPRVRALRASRTAALRRADVVMSPSAYLRELAIGWGLDPGGVVVVPNPAPSPPALPPRETLRAELALDGPSLAFAGRLTAQKDLDVAFDALADVPAATLVVLGDGPERASLERRVRDAGLNGRVRFLGSGTRDDVLRLFRAADAAVLPSRWENMPHTVLEALAVGTPVVAAAVGGVPEVVHDGENGLLVPPGDAAALGAAIARVLDDHGLRERLAAAAAPSVAPLAEDVLLGRIEALLVEVARA